MNKINVRDLTPDTYYNSIVFLDKQFILTTADIILSDKTIKKLKEWSIKEIYTEGHSVTYPGYKKEATANSDPVSLHAHDEDKKQEHEGSLQYYTSTIKFFEKVFNSFSVTGEFDRSLITDKIKQMKERMEDHKDFYISLPEIVNVNYIVQDSLRSAFLCLALAEMLKFPIHRQIEIATAAMLHDIGMFKIPKQIYMNDRKLSDQEKQVIRAHVSLGARTVKECGFSNDIVQSILEHHENFDGSGYPMKLAGASISMYGRIIGVVTAYIAATSSRLYRSGMQGHSGIIDILKQTNTRYDPNIIKAFIMMVSIYPLGTFVEIEDGRKGIVSKTSVYNPKNPVVRILMDTEGFPLPDKKEVHTLATGCAVKRVLSASEISALKSSFKKSNISKDGVSNEIDE